MPQTAQEQHGGESQGHTAAKAKQQQQQQRQPASWWARQQERMREDQKKRMAKPDPWIALKLAVGICVALLIYCYYVYVGRVCYPMLRQLDGARGSRTQGIVYLVLFNILWLLLCYTYALIVLTSPGLANDYVPKGPCPEPPFHLPSTTTQQRLPTGPALALTRNQPPRQLAGHASAGPVNVQHQPVSQEGDAPDPDRSTDAAGGQTALARPHTTGSEGSDTLAPPNTAGIARYSTVSHQTAVPVTDQAGFTPAPGVELPEQAIANEDSQKAAFGPGLAQAARKLAGTETSRNPAGSPAHTPSEDTPGLVAPATEAGKKQTAEPRRSVAASVRSWFNFDGPLPASSSSPAKGEARDLQETEKISEKGVWRTSRPWGTAGRADDETNGKAKPPLVREVPLSGPLHPYLRYCNKCEIVKPYRTHHCRHCGTCILNMDHHCPWIGQCVGAHNHIYFVTFCFWACISLGYVFITLLVALLAPNVTPRPSIEAQTTVICAIAAVFSLFTGSMAVSHWVLILQGQSTIESMAIADMKHWESTKLNSAHGMLGLRAKRETKAAWDREWGPLDTEGNLWYRDSRKQNWTAVMGTRVLAWFIPPPKYRPDDGLSYLPNPRRGPDGKWIRRSEWPEELR